MQFTYGQYNIIINQKVSAIEPQLEKFQLLFFQVEIITQK